MNRVVAIVLLRSIPAGSPGVNVTLAEFGPAEPYQFGDTAGMIRFTPVSFVGRFAVPNDFRAVLGELR